MNEAGKLLKGSYLYPSTENEKLFENEDEDLTKNFHLSAVDLDKADMRCLKKPLMNFLDTCSVKELYEKGLTSIDTAFANSVDSKMPPKIPERSKI
jgi:hypothetical protein